VNDADWIRKRMRNLGRGCVLLPLGALALGLGLCLIA
jgi:hypothetical protein